MALELEAMQAAGGYGPPGGGYGGPPPGGGYPPGGGGFGTPPGGAPPGGYGGPPGGYGGPPPGGFGAPPPGGYGMPPAGYGPGAQGPSAHPLAIVSLITGILALPLCCCFGVGIPFGLASVVCGFLALSAIKQSPQRYKGGGMAIAGIICGSLGVLSSISMFFTTIDDEWRAKYLH
jgi:hypothetical protein